MQDSDPFATFHFVSRSLADFPLAYLHVVEPLEPERAGEERITPVLRDAFDGPLVVNGGYGSAAGHEAIRSGDADAIAFGTLFIANPDLPRRFALGAALNEPDRSTFYGGDERGYTDYPSLGERTSASA